MTTLTEARIRRHAARQPHLRQEMAGLRLHFRHFMRAHKADIRRYNEMAAQLAAVTAERDALRRELANMTGELCGHARDASYSRRVVCAMILASMAH